MFRRNAIGKPNRGIERRRDQNRARLLQRLPRRIRFRQIAQLLFYFSRNSFRESRRWSDQQRDRVRIVLGLRQKIRGDIARRSAGREDQHFRRAGRHVNRAIVGDDALRGGNVAIAGAANLVHARNRLRAVGERADRLRAAHARNFRHAQNFSSGEQRGTRLRAGHDDALYASHLRRDRRHQQSGEKRKTSAGNVAPDGSERRDALADAHSRFDRDGP